MKAKRKISKEKDERIKKVYVTRKDFCELKAIVKELAQAQKKTEIRLKELAEAQKKTEEEIRTLTVALKNTRGDFGGLSRSVSYALENEAYRILPQLLKDRYGIELQERLIRTELAGKEINVFAKGKKDGRDILIIGETKLRLDDHRKEEKEEIFDTLEEKVAILKEVYKIEEIVKILITHYATKGFLNEANEKGIIVIQSFEW